MKAPRKLKEDVSNKFPYIFLEKKKHNKYKVGSMYKNEPQTAVAGLKHAAVTDANKILHRKRKSKPLNPIFQKSLSQRGKTRGEEIDIFTAGKIRRQ